MGRRSTVCGIAVRLMSVSTYGGGKFAPGARNLGQVARVSAATASKLLAPHGKKRIREGYEVKLCDQIYLSNSAGQYEVVTRGGAALAGARRRR